LEEKIKEKINPNFKDKITLQDERDLFVGYLLPWYVKIQVNHLPAVLCLEPSTPFFVK